MASRRPPDSTRTPTTSPVTANPIPSDAEVAPTVKAKAPAARKPRAPRAAAKQPTASTGAGVTKIQISEDVRRGMIAEAAYLRAERRGFMGGPDREREDWLAAETEVDALLKAGHGSSAQ